MARSRLACYMGQSFNFIPDISCYIEKTEGTGSCFTAPLFLSIFTETGNIILKNYP